MIWNLRVNNKIKKSNQLYGVKRPIFWDKLSHNLWLEVNEYSFQKIITKYKNNYYLLSLHKINL